MAMQLSAQANHCMEEVKGHEADDNLATIELLSKYNSKEDLHWYLTNISKFYKAIRV